MVTKKTKKSLSKDLRNFLDEYDVTIQEFADHMKRSTRHVYNAKLPNPPYKINENEVYNAMDAWVSRVDR